MIHGICIFHIPTSYYYISFKEDTKNKLNITYHISLLTKHMI